MHEGLLSAHCWINSINEHIPQQQVLLRRRRLGFGRHQSYTTRLVLTSTGIPDYEKWWQNGWLGVADSPTMSKVSCLRSVRIMIDEHDTCPAVTESMNAILFYQGQRTKIKGSYGLGHDHPVKRQWLRTAPTGNIEYESGQHSLLVGS